MNIFFKNYSFVIIFLIFFSTRGFAMELTSPAFSDGNTIPTIYTCDGQNISPPLLFSGIPRGARSLVLIFDDPDAPSGTWTHWILYNIPPTTTSLPENVSTLPKGTEIGLNSWEKKEYSGACPPEGTHHYFFRLYALKTVLKLHGAVSNDSIRRAMKENILATATLMGNYQRR